MSAWAKIFYINKNKKLNETPSRPVRKLINRERPDLNEPWLQLNQEEESSHHHFGAEIDYGSRVDWILANYLLQAMEILWISRSQITASILRITTFWKQDFAGKSYDNQLAAVFETDVR